MINQLSQLIEQNGQRAIMDNPAVPNRYNEQVIRELQKAITCGLHKLAAMPGHMEELRSFSQKDQLRNHPVVQQISGNFMGRIIDQIGLSYRQASDIAAAIIPVVIKQLSYKAGEQGTGIINLI